MKKSIATLITTCLFLTIGVVAPSSAQNNPSIDNEANKRWYRVELIIFRQGGNPNEHVERWDTNISLSYPEEWVTLVEQEEESTLAPEGSLILLPESELTLQDKARKLQRSNRYRVLFHGAWDLGMIERAKSPSILIEGGNTFGDYRELAGSIELNLQRYLHITTNLWITDFATNFGQETRDWPTIPLAPTHPNYESQRNGFSVSQSVSQNIASFNNPSQSSQFNNDWRADDNQGFNNDNNFGSRQNNYDSLISSPYVIENIAPIKLTRRMRSKELHYLDHPLAGILIQFTPLEASASDEDSLEAQLEEALENE